MRNAVAAAMACVVILTAASRQSAADKAALIQLRNSCTACHTLEVVKAQHLSREVWDRELTKMSLMGARVADRQALLDYLEKKYGETRHPR
jgi:hypothetical protein